MFIYTVNINHSVSSLLLDYTRAKEYDLITVDSIKVHHKRLKGEIHSLYQESIYAHASEKLSYDIIGLISLIDQVKNAALPVMLNRGYLSQTLPPVIITL